MLHGLGNAVLPLRGVDHLGPGTWSAGIILLYQFAILGFIAAGLGVLGVHILRRVAADLAMVSGAASLIGWFELGQRDLWFGALLSAVLPGLTMVWVRRSQAAPSLVVRPRWRVAGEAVGWAFFAWMAASSLLWPFHRGWGAAPAEWAMALPGDRTPRTPSLELLHGVTIDAPPEVVWSWLIQLGQDRAGFYSYD